MSRVYRREHPFVPYEPERLSPEEMAARARAFYTHLDRRRSVRHFRDDPVPRELIELAIRSAGTAPSGAHQQPWTFVAVSDPATKARIREAAEAEEKRSYESRMSQEWLEAIGPMGTDWQKPYLETVPWIVVLFAQSFGLDPDGTKRKHYYVPESCGIAAGMFITALHDMGLCTLTHTPSPMKFLGELLGRPANERATILFPIGYAADDALVPDIERKPLDQIAVFVEGESD
ncbi:MAG: nitroreductase family protein [Myxococcota bacterium]